MEEGAMIPIDDSRAVWRGEGNFWSGLLGANYHIGKFGEILFFQLSRDNLRNDLEKREYFDMLKCIDCLEIGAGTTREYYK